MARPRTQTPEHQVVSVRFPRIIWDQCRDVAEQEDRSLNEQLLHIVKRWLATEKNKDQRDVLSPSHPDRPRRIRTPVGA